ncbi:MAG: hypothetical protein D6798_06640 [Deltaproteobacteria bacterium]|nr:MAG: hypothetical protein D6798_06640 [Deltaproteobacteria bacterium]
MTRILGACLALASLGGCIIYDAPCDGDETWSDGSGHGQAGQGDALDTGADVEQDLGLTMVPDTLAQGETAIVSLVADRPVDWSTVTDVQFYGDLTPCAMQPRDDELLLTLSVAPDARLGGVDLVVETEDGDAWWAEDVLFIVEAGDGGADGSGADGSGADGSDAGNGGQGGSSSSDSTSGSTGCG